MLVLEVESFEEKSFSVLARGFHRDGLVSNKIVAYPLFSKGIGGEWFEPEKGDLLLAFTVLDGTVVYLPVRLGKDKKEVEEQVKRYKDFIKKFGLTFPFFVEEACSSVVGKDLNGVVHAVEGYFLEVVREGRGKAIKRIEIGLEDGKGEKQEVVKGNSIEKVEGVRILEGKKGVQIFGEKIEIKGKDVDLHTILVNMQKQMVALHDQVKEVLDLFSKVDVSGGSGSAAVLLPSFKVMLNTKKPTISEKLSEIKTNLDSIDKSLGDLFKDGITVDETDLSKEREGERGY